MISTHNYGDNAKPIKHQLDDVTEKAISTRNNIPYGVQKETPKKVVIKKAGAK
jgi:hypothetical protein